MLEACRKVLVCQWQIHEGMDAVWIYIPGLFTEIAVFCCNLICIFYISHWKICNDFAENSDY